MTVRRSSSQVRSSHIIWKKRLSFFQANPLKQNPKQHIANPRNESLDTVRGEHYS